MVRLTQANVRSLQCPPGKKLTYLWDSAIAGLGVRAAAGGVLKDGAARMLSAQVIVFRCR